MPRAATAKNHEALGQHRHAHYDQSLVGFEAAIALAPNFTMAHYNRACALSRLGRMADAATELEGVMRTDLVEFGKRLESDDDLAPLMASSEGARLLAARTALTAEYAAAVAHGIPVMLYATEQVEAGASMATVSKHHRAGVYLPDGARFVPLTPSVDHSFALVWSPETASVTVLHGPLTSAYYTLFPSHLSVDVYSLSAPGTLVASAHHVDAAFARHFPELAALPAEGEEEAVTMYAMSYHEIHVRPYAEGVQLQVDVAHDETVDTMMLDVGAGHPTVARAARAHTSDYDVRVVEGVIVDSALPEGYSFHRNRLTLPGRPAPIELGPLVGRKQVVVTRDGSAAYVLAVRSECDTLSHRLVRVDLASGVVTQLHAGRHGATLVASADGSVFVQLHDAVKRITETGELVDSGLPAWLKLAYPIAESDCSM